MKRRAFIATTATTTTAVLAGCLGGGGGNPTKSPESVIEAYLELGNSGGLSAGDIEPLLHSESPVDPQTAADRTGKSVQNIGGVNYDITDMEENLTQDTLQSTVSESTFRIGDSAVETVASQPNRLATVDVQFEVDLSDQRGSERIKERIEELLDVEMEILVAKENDEWLVVDNSVALLQYLEESLGSVTVPEGSI